MTHYYIQMREISVNENLGPQTSHTIYFSNIDENKISDRETPVELSLEPPYGTEPILIISISTMRHSGLFC